LLNAGYVDIHNLTKREEYKTEGTPQNSIISPLLANIYLHELDVFTQDEITPKYASGKTPPADQDNMYRKSHVLKSNKKILNNETSYYKKEDYYKRLYYVRYADDLLLGAVGNKEDCRKIVTKINKFLKENLKLELNLDKCFINLA
jgi:retron-type reverse transcriptase